MHIRIHTDCEYYLTIAITVNILERKNILYRDNVRLKENFSQMRVYAL